MCFGSLFGGGKQQAPTLPPPPPIPSPPPVPTPSESTGQTPDERKRRRDLLRSGIASTIKTSQRGVLQPFDTSLKQRLG